jgi:DNA-directed RNA polymerase specialized sigma24 family protein
MHSDSDLLQLFNDSGDEAAFTQLVQRHAGMVRAVIWRRTQDWSLVDEATWKVFAVLARKAKSLQGQPLAGWLHRAARHEAGNAARKAGC